MDETGRRKGPARGLDDLPEWMRSLKGFDQLRFKQFEGGDAPAGREGMLAGARTGEGGAWRLALVMPGDVAEAAERIDPLLLLPGLAGAIEELEARVGEVVRYCRATGRTWTQIGEALSVSKQAAWQRFSGEE